MCIRDSDYEEVRRIAIENKPKLIVAGASAYARVIDFKKFREIADEVGAYLMVDMAHIAGLVAGGQHPSPIPYADVVTTTTHKTLRGPRAVSYTHLEEALEILKQKKKGNYNVIQIDENFVPAPLEHKEVFGAIEKKLHTPVQEEWEAEDDEI